MFVDQVKIQVKAGTGGNGMVAFRREKYVPNGGPAGGDGGHGGDIIFKVDSGMSTLMDFRYHRKFKGDNGGNGANKQMTGRGAENTVIPVPEGTSIYDEETGVLLADLVDVDQEVVIAHGGRGGRGNIHFASPNNPAPEIAENGEPGEERSLKLELKVLADVGLVGFPSAGKSTLLATLTSAKPKVAGYHFTTLVPNLGMVRLDDGRDFVMADLPGLIEGASEGVGLGIQFLRHVERTRVILHVVDVSGTEGRNPYEDFVTINEELRKYDQDLLNRPQIVVASKMDMPDSAANLEQFKLDLAKEMGEQQPVVVPISAITHTGLDELVAKTADMLAVAKQQNLGEVAENEENHRDYEFVDDGEAPFNISYDKEYETWDLSGAQIEKLFKMTDTTHDQSMLRFARQLRGMGVDQALRDAGAKDGDTVTILDFTFSYVE